MDGLPSHYGFAPLIQRNTPLPSRRSEIFSTMYDGQKAARIAVFQGEDDDVRQNDPVGDFLLDGLAAVDAGNEILVQFDLDLDGILKVSALERSTGRRKELTIDNTVTRFRAGNRQEALARVEAAFVGGTDAISKEKTPAAAPEPALPPADLPAAMAQLINRCEELIVKSEDLAKQSNPADAAEMRQLVEQLRGAILRRSQADMEGVVSQLEDLVFYLQDA